MVNNEVERDVWWYIREVGIEAETCVRILHLRLNLDHSKCWSYSDKVVSVNKYPHLLC